MQVPEHAVVMIQIDGTRRQVYKYIKFVDISYVQDVLHMTNGQSEYKLITGEMSPVCIEMAGMGTRSVRIANLPPEVTEGTVRAALSQYGEIKTIQEETWSKAYRHAVANGITVVVIALTKQLPSHMTIAGNRVLTSYEGQLQTCYGCGDTGHMYWVCPKGTGARIEPPTTPGTTWVHITANGTNKRRSLDEERKDEAHCHEQTEQAGIRQMGEDEHEPRPIPPPSSNETGGKDASRQHMTHTRDTSVPAQDRWADDDPKKGETMEAQVETADDKMTDRKERPQPTHPLEDPGARTDTEEIVEPEEEQDACKAAHPGYKSTAPGAETQTEVAGNGPNRTKK